MTSLLDSNVFITSKNFHYDIDIFPGFWEWLVDANDRGVVFSSDRVFAELKGQKDALFDWAKPLGPKFFVPFDYSMANAMQDVITWTDARACSQAARTEFLGVAGSFIVAHAKAKGMTVVTFELSRPAKQNQIFIPDACIGLGVPFARPWDVLRFDKPSFIRGPAVESQAAPLV
jgi:hypothetical protein